MVPFFFYLLKSILVSGVLLGYYWLALRNNRFHHYNRFYLLATVLFSLTLPLLKMEWFVITAPSALPVQDFLIGNESVQSIPTTPTAFSWDIQFFIFGGLVAVYLMARHLVGIVQLYRLKAKSVVTRMEQIDFVETGHEDAPFSFLANLFWKQGTPLDSTEGKQIFRHELAHIEERHSLDNLLVGFIQNIFWLNPFLWLIRKELTVIHEFIADEKTIQDNDPSALATMLLNAHFPSGFAGNGQSYFYSSIKRRIMMFTLSKNPRYSYARRLLVIPIIASIVLLSSFTISKMNAGTSVQELPSANEMRIAIIDTTPKVEWAQGADGKEYRVKMSGEWAIFSDPKTKKEVFRMPKIQLAPPPPPPMPRAPHVVSGIQIDSFSILDDASMSVSGDADKGIRILGTPLILVDGKPVQDMYAIKPADIASVKIWKEKGASALIDTLAANGVIMIATKSAPNLMPVTVVGHPLPIEKKEEKEITVVGYGKKKITGKDGNEFTVITTKDKVIVDKAIEMKAVQTVEVKEENGQKIYTVTYRQTPVQPELPLGLVYMLDGKEISVEEMKAFSPTKIQSMNVLKGKMAEEKYGEKGKNGVIEIISKK